MIIQAEKNFLSQKTAQDLRRYFLNVFENPRRSHPKRFMWDHWFIENQYKMHRTPAQDFFSQPLYKKLCNELVKYGQDILGCHTISKPWLSYYTEGDSQSLHTDSPHGPWAYVYSLTDWIHREFKGGETQILKPEVLNYWPNYSRRRGREMHDLFLNIEPHFNQLLIFDPRLPHGVRRISGVEDPCKSRLVVHGWYVHPEPYVVGSLGRANLEELMSKINLELAPVLQKILKGQDARGTIVFRVKILSSGRVSHVKTLTNTLIDSEGSHAVGILMAKYLSQKLKNIMLLKSRGTTELTLPLIFD